jgi:hypothetical protein
VQAAAYSVSWIVTGIVIGVIYRPMPLSDPQIIRIYRNGLVNSYKGIPKKSLMLPVGTKPFF